MLYLTCGSIQNPIQRVTNSTSSKSKIISNGAYTHKIALKTFTTKVISVLKDVNVLYLRIMVHKKGANFIQKGGFQIVT